MSRSPSPFRVPSAPSRAMSTNAVSFFLGEVISAAEAARPQVGSLRAHDVRSVSTSVAFHRNWSVTSVLLQPLGPPVRCSHLFLFATSNTNMVAYFLLVPSWLRVLGWVSPHLFLISSGGGGGAISSWSPLSQGSSTFPSAGCGVCPSCCWWGDRVHPFYCGFLVILCRFLSLLFLLYCACPCLPSVPWVGFAGVTQDVASDSVPFLGFRLLAMSGLVYYLTRSLDIYL